MDYICAKFRQILTILLVVAYYGALHASLQDLVINVHITVNTVISKLSNLFSSHFIPMLFLIRTNMSIM